MIKRNSYLNKLIQVKGNGFPKVITGIRRCGKSYLLMELFKNHLIESGVDEKNIIKIDLDEKINYPYYDPLKLYDLIISRCDKTTINYVLIDEIQNVKSILNPTFTRGEHILAKPNDENAITFSNIILSLSKEKFIDLYVTGSNSRMLSTDIRTEFRDKATLINIFPLSFDEYVNYVGNSDYETVNEFLLYGGMPLAVLSTLDNKAEYLKNLFETTYFKDIIERYRFKKTEALDELCTLLSTCVGSLINSSSLSKIYQDRTKSRIDSDTVESYIKAFKESHIISEANRYDIKGKRIISSLKKYYFVDTGLRNAKLNFAYSDLGEMVENVVYNELIFNGYNVNVGTYDKVEKNKNKVSIRKTYEIDFLATKGNRMFYIQTAENISDEKTRLREIKPYISLNDQIQKIVVINRPIKEMRDKDGYIVVGLAEFLLKSIK